MVQTTKLGGSDVVVGRIGHGLMMMTWTAKPVPDEVCFEAIKTSLDSVPAGCKMILNSGEFYGMNPKTANLELLARFFEKYPEYQDKAFLSVKGGVNLEKLAPDSSPEGLRKSVDTINEKLRGTKRLDMFECARVDSNYPIEETMKVLAGLIREGKFDYIGLSECSAATMRRAHAVYPVVSNEIEVSPWSYDQAVKDAISTAEELGISIVAYAPLGRGFLTGRYKTREEFENDVRAHQPRLSGENFDHNMKLVNGLKAIAEKNSITAAQLSLAWVCSLGPHVIPIPGSSNKTRTAENLIAAEITLSPQDSAAIAKVLEENPVQGSRSAAQDSHLMK